MSLVILSKNLMELWIRSITICSQGLLCHSDTAVRHKSSLQRFISLKTYDLLVVLHGLIDISRTISIDIGNNICLHIQHATLGSLLLLILLKLSPEPVRALCRSLKETLISVIRGVVFLDKVTNVDIIVPVTRREAFPCFKICHYDLQMWLYLWVKLECRC